MEDVKFASTRAKKINSISNKMKRRGGGEGSEGYQALAQSFAAPPGMPNLTEQDLSTSLDPSLKQSTRNI